MSKIRKIFTISVMLVTVLSMSVVVVPQVDAAASAGDLIKMNGLSTVYYLGADSKRYVFPNEQTYFSWYSDYSSVVTIPQSELESYSLGGNVTMRPGTKLVKITTNPKVYAVEADGTLRWVSTEAIAKSLYGDNWAKRVVDVADAFFTNYVEKSNAVTATAYPEGSLVKFGTSADVYYINADGTASKVATEAAFNANRFKWADVITSALTLPSVGAQITSAVKTDTSQGGGGVGVIAGGGSGLTVALASDTPAAATTIAETGVSAQALVPVTKVNFTASADGAVKVTNVKFKRAGVPSTDADFADFYLYDGNTLLAKYNSVSDNVLTFNNAAGLFTVPAGTTKGVTLKVNLDKDVVGSRAYNFSVLSASDVTTGGATVSGSFPVSGNTMTTAAVTDLGQLTVTHSANSSAPNPGALGHSIWKFTAAAVDQNMDVERMKFTIIGTVDTTDLANFKLDVGGVQIGSTVAAMASDKTVTFDFATPYRIDKGVTKTVTLKADVMGGTSRTYRVYFYDKEDVVVKDAQYGIYVTPNQADTWTKISAAAATTISTGTLTVSKNIASPSGNVALGSTNVEIGKFDFKATGEAIKVTSVWIYVDTTASGGLSNDGLHQVKLYVDGSQVGTAVDLAEASGTGTEVATGNSFIIPAGTTKTLVVKSDIKDDDGGALASDVTITFQLGTAKSVDYTLQTTGTTGTSGALSANVLTVKTGALTAAENSSFGDRSSSAPSGTVNATGVKVASFTLTAGAGEAVTVTQITLADDATTEMGDNFQNLVLKNGSTQIGTTIGTLNTTASTYDFSPSPAINIPAGGQYVVDVYADIKSSAADPSINLNGIYFASATATGDVTSGSATADPTDFELQTIYIASAGNLNISDGSDEPVAQQLVMGTTDQEVAKFKFEATASEDLDITQLIVSDSVSSAATGTLKNIKLYDGTTLLAGPVQLATSATTTYAHAVFNNISVTVPAGGSKTLTVKADVATAGDGATSASTHAFAILHFDDLTGEAVVVKGKQSGTVLTEAANTIDFYGTTDTALDTDQTGNTMTVYRTKVSVAFATDTPSGARTGQSAETIAKFNVTNTANVGNYAATIKAINFALSTTISNTADRSLKIYKDSITTANLVATTSWLAAGDQNFGNTAITNGTSNATNFVDVEIAAGATKLFIVTLDTTDATASGDFSLSVNLAEGDITWSDSTTGSSISTVNTLPLEAKTLTY